MKTTICCQSGVIGAKGADDDADEQRHRRDLGRGGEEGGDRRRRAFVDVGRPHVERHGRDLEGEAGERKTRPKIRPSDGSPPASAAAMPAKPVWPVKP